MQLLANEVIAISLSEGDRQDEYQWVPRVAKYTRVWNVYKTYYFTGHLIVAISDSLTF